MMQSIAHVALLVRDYDEALDFYVGILGFRLIEDLDQPEQRKRWVTVAPPGASGTSLLLARASTPEQEAFIGNQTGGRVFLFLQTDDFWRDYQRLSKLAYGSCANPARNRTARSPYSRTSTATAGTFFEYAHASPYALDPEHPCEHAGCIRPHMPH